MLGEAMPVLEDKGDRYWRHIDIRGAYADLGSLAIEFSQPWQLVCIDFVLITLPRRVASFLAFVIIILCRIRILVFIGPLCRGALIRLLLLGRFKARVQGTTRPAGRTSRGARAFDSGARSGPQVRRPPITTCCSNDRGQGACLAQACPSRARSCQDLTPCSSCARAPLRSPQCTDADWQRWWWPGWKSQVQLPMV